MAVDRTLNFLSDEEVRLLQELLNERRQRYRDLRTMRDDNIERDEILTPEVYVCRTPSAGIPALVQSSDTGTATGSFPEDRDRPGYADCGIYRLITTSGVKRLHSIGISKRVYNLMNVAVPGLAWVLAHRDKFGDWFVAALGFEFADCDADTGTATSSSTSTSTSTAGGGGGDCFFSGACGDAGVAASLTATITAKVGCFTSAPDTILFSCQQSPSSGGFDPNNHLYGAGGVVGNVCGQQVNYDPIGGINDLRGWAIIGSTGSTPPGLDMFKYIQPGDFTLRTDADDGWTCAPMSAVFHVDDGAGNTCTVAVVED